MDLSLTPGQEIVVATVRRFVGPNSNALEPEIEETGRCPREVGQGIRRKALQLGFCAPNIPEAHGGYGLDTVTPMLLERELAQRPASRPRPGLVPLNGALPDRGAPFGGDKVSSERFQAKCVRFAARKARQDNGIGPVW